MYPYFISQTTLSATTRARALPGNPPTIFTPADSDFDVPRRRRVCRRPSRARDLDIPRLGFVLQPLFGVILRDAFGAGEHARVS